jgi:hypothetical protein
MAEIHRTTMTPGKLELLAGWLPKRPWFIGNAAAPLLGKAGGFRLDDPEGEVGIEVMVVTDASVDGAVTSYLVPMTYRGAPLGGAADALIGTSEHGVLGRRWIYDAGHDPVFVTQLMALLQGDVEAQHQSESDTADPSVAREWRAAGRVAIGASRAVDTADGTVIELGNDDAAAAQLSLRVTRRLGDAAAPQSAEVVGRAVAGWQLPDGSRVRGVMFEAR